MDNTFESLCSRVHPSWWPDEIRKALLTGTVARSARYWCLKWWDELSASSCETTPPVSSQPEDKIRQLEAKYRDNEVPVSVLRHWALSENRIFFHIAECLGLSLFRHHIRRIINAERMEAFRLLIGTQRVNSLITEFPEFSLEPLELQLPDNIDAYFLSECQTWGLQLGLACARQQASELKYLFEVSLPLDKVDSRPPVPVLTIRQLSSLTALIQFVVKKYGAPSCSLQATH
jgi:hypothetical protein